jgi:Ca-activated chloride channel homolog
MIRYCLTVALCLGLVPVVDVRAAQQPAPQESVDQPVFRTSIEMVSMAAVVRDKRGRVVRALSREDFQVLDAGEPRTIVDMRSEVSAPASVALLVDGSGSMRIGETLDLARVSAEQILDSLNATRDEAALYTFDKYLIELHEFSKDLDGVRTRLEAVEAFGQTSLYDAIAGTARRIASRADHRRAIVVLTDGADTSSTMSPAEVSAIASSIDVPVYVFALTDAGSTEAYPNPLADLARWTGGDYYPVASPAHHDAAIRRLGEELRHQYVLAFEPAGSTGWRRVEIRTRRPGFTVRTRSWYLGSN